MVMTAGIIAMHVSRRLPRSRNIAKKTPSRVRIAILRCFAENSVDDIGEDKCLAREVFRRGGCFDHASNLGREASYFDAIVQAHRGVDQHKARIELAVFQPKLSGDILGEVSEVERLGLGHFTQLFDPTAELAGNPGASSLGRSSRAAR